MINDNYIDDYISKIMMEKNKEECDNHKSSGKLSASQLGVPLQWQILKIKGVCQQPFDEYTLRKFQRGKDVEKWFISVVPNLVEEQKFVEYRNVVGYADTLIDTTTHHFNCGVIPHEVKSVTNEKFKRIIKDGNADRSHRLQCGLYALALGKDKFAIDYIASDDYRIKTYIYDTAEIKDEIDGIITRFDKQLATGLVPVFVPEEMWQSSLKYSNYPDFMNKSEDEIKILLKEKYGITLCKSCHKLTENYAKKA